MVKFNGMINFGTWRCDVIDALFVQGLEDTIELDTSLTKIAEKDRIRKDRIACAGSDHVLSRISNSTCLWSC